MVFQWFRDTLARRSALVELKRQAREDADNLARSDQNPVRMARFAIDTGKREEAEKWWEEARRLMPDHLMKNRDALHVMFMLHRYDEADALMLAGKRKYPHDLYYWAGYAETAARREDWPEAVKRWKAARKLDPTNRDVWFHGGLCLAHINAFDEADECLAKAAEMASEDHFVVREYAINADRRQDWAASARRWRLIAEQFGTNESVTKCAMALIRQGLMIDAEMYLAQATRFGPPDLDTAVIYAFLAETRADWAEAAERWAAVRAREPAFEHGFQRGAFSLAANGRQEEAAAILLDAAERFPDAVWPLQDHARLAEANGDAAAAADRWATLDRKFSMEIGTRARGEPPFAPNAADLEKILPGLLA